MTTSGGALEDGAGLAPERSHLVERVGAEGRVEGRARAEAGCGALAGGLVLGVAEALAAGYVSSAYKDAVAFLVLIAVLFVRPQGIFGARASDRG